MSNIHDRTSDDFCDLSGALDSSPFNRLAKFAALVDVQVLFPHNREELIDDIMSTIFDDYCQEDSPYSFYSYVMSQYGEFFPVVRFGN